MQDHPRMAVEGAERFVEQQDVRVAGKRHQQGDSLPHAAGQVVRKHIAEPCEAAGLKQGGDLRVDRGRPGIPR